MIPANAFEVFRHAPDKEWKGNGTPPAEYGHYWHALAEDGSKSNAVGPFDTGHQATMDALS